MKRIKLTRGKYALVDDNDFDFISQWKWNLSSKGYAQRTIFSGKVDGKNKTTTLKMHRLINKTPIGVQTDHINGNRVDNQKHNLRNSTRSQNMWNMKKTRGKSKYKGVHWHEKKWLASIAKNGRRVHLGLFSKEEDAAQAYNSAAIKLHGEFAMTNEIKSAKGA